jgi:hypothetical protein
VHVEDRSRNLFSPPPSQFDDTIPEGIFYAPVKPASDAMTKWPSMVTFLARLALSLGSGTVLASNFRLMGRIAIAIGNVPRRLR